MQNRFWSIFWCCALIGCVPAILSTTLFPSSWFGGAIITSVDAGYIQWWFRLGYAALFFGGIALLLLARLPPWGVAGLVPLALLAFLPPDRVSLDNRLLTDQASLEKVAADYVVGPAYLRPGVAPADIDTIADRAGSSLQISPAVAFFGLAPGAEAYQAQWDNAQRQKFREALRAAPIDVNAETPSMPLLKVAGAALQRVEDAFEAYWNCAEPGLSPNPPIEGAFNQRPFGRPSNCGREPKPGELQAARERVNQLNAAVKAEKQELLDRENRRVEDAKMQTDLAFGRIFALEAAGAQSREWFRSLLYSVSAFAALMLFTATATFRSWPLAVTVIASGLAIVGQASGAQTDMSLLGKLPGFMLGAYPVVLFLLGGVALRLLVLAVVQNYEILRQLDRSSVLRQAFRATLTWLPPFALLTLAGMWFSGSLGQAASNFVYSIEMWDEDDSNSEPAKYLIEKGDPPDLRTDIDRGIDQRFAETEAHFASKLNDWSVNADAGANWLVVGIISTFAETVPPSLGCSRHAPNKVGMDCIGFEYSGDYECGFPGVGCRARRKAMRIANDVYASTRGNGNEIRRKTQ